MPRKSIKESKDQLYKAAFDEVIEHYQSLKHSSDAGIKSLDYSRMEGSGSSRANIITVSKTDFICDVELAVRKVIGEDKHLLNLFGDCYVHLTQIPQTESPDIDKIRREVGRMFTVCRISPVTGYFRPKPIDRSKGKK